MVENLSGQSEFSRDIAILVGSNIPIGSVQEILSTVPLPKPFRVSLTFEKGGYNVYLETIARFKGLESQCVFLLTRKVNSNFNQEVYVGGTRATHELHIIMVEGEIRL